MRTRSLGLPLLILLVLVLCPAALAGTATLEEGVHLDGLHVLVRVEGAPAPVAETPLLLSVELSGPRSATVREVRAVLDDERREGGAFLVPPSTALPVTSAPDLRLHQTRLLLPEPGPVRLRVLVDGVEAAAFDLQVLPAGPAWPDWATPEDALAFEGEEATPQVRLLDAGGRRLPMPEDARVVVRDAAAPAGAPPALDVALSAEGRFDASGLPGGEYTVETLAPTVGLVPGAREPLRLLVAPSDEADVYEQPPTQGERAQTPGAGFSGLAAAALVAACLLALRRPRA